MAYTTINKSTDYFNTLLYTGNDGTGRSITGVGFQPDFVWVKDRSNSYDHGLFDAVRGATKALNSNDASAEDTISNSLTAFGSDGFTAGANTIINGNNNNYASWNWKANGTGSANTAGSINSTVSANTTSGFSIVKYTGTGANATVGHGLGVAPKMIHVKGLGNANNWLSGGTNISSTWASSLHLNTIASIDTYAYWQNQIPNANTFAIGSDGALNQNGIENIAYCFADVQGYSKFGSYTGNGNADGPFVYTGFKPSFVMIKLSTAADDWQIFDNKRNTFNIMDKYLRPNSPLTDITNAVIDFTSNGFKLRSSAGSFNPSGATAIYMAFAEAPLVGSNNVPANAR